VGRTPRLTIGPWNTRPWTGSVRESIDSRSPTTGEHRRPPPVLLYVMGEEAWRFETCLPSYPDRPSTFGPTTLSQTFPVNRTRTPTATTRTPHACRRRISWLRGGGCSTTPSWSQDSADYTSRMGGDVEVIGDVSARSVPLSPPCRRVRRLCDVHPAGRSYNVCEVSSACPVPTKSLRPCHWSTGTVQGGHPSRCRCPAARFALRAHQAPRIARNGTFFGRHQTVTTPSRPVGGDLRRWPRPSVATHQRQANAASRTSGEDAVTPSPVAACASQRNSCTTPGYNPSRQCRPHIVAPIAGTREQRRSRTRTAATREENTRPSVVALTKITSDQRVRHRVEVSICSGRSLVAVRHCRTARYSRYATRPT